jgi:hypothetical protein
VVVIRSLALLTMLLATSAHALVEIDLKTRCPRTQ